MRCIIFCLQLLLLTFSLSLHLSAEVLKVTSNPSGAKVEINGVFVGTTPYEVKLPGGYFHKTHVVTSARLEHPMLLRVTLDGYSPKEIEMTEGPMHWMALNGTYHGDYWLLKTDHFDVVLEPLSKSFTGTINATAPGNSRIEMRAELPIEELVERSKQAVVLLTGSSRLGSGFLVSETGVIVTNAHVVRGESSAVATLSSGQKLDARVVYSDPDMDIALLKVDGTGFPRLSLTDVSNVRQGQTVVAIGNPGLGMPFSVTKGIVSAIGGSSASTQFWQDVFALLRRREVLVALALFVAPCGTFSLTNVLSGIGNDFLASPRFVNLVGGLGVVAAGIFGSLLLPPLAKRMPLRPLYLTVGVVGSLMTLALIPLPRTAATFAFATLGEMVFQSIAIACSVAICFEAIGQHNPLAATTFSFPISAYNVPISYMLAVDGWGYGRGGVSGAFGIDAALGIVACLLMGALLLFLHRLERRRITVKAAE